MYCPFLKVDCYPKCAFRSTPVQTTGGLQNTPNTCILAIAANELIKCGQAQTKAQNS